MPLPCPECEVAAGSRLPAGGLLLSTEGFLVHGVLGSTPLPGWCVVASRRHVLHLADLTPGEQAEAMELAARVAAAQRSLLGAPKSYLALFAEVVPHFHLHVIPRYESTPDHLRGPRAFQAAITEMASEAETRKALETLREGLGRAR